jgi:N-acetylmuramoyl-L-alanine amidase
MATIFYVTLDVTLPDNYFAGASMGLGKLVAITVAVVALGSISSATLLAQDDVTARAYRTVNVRSGPSTTYPVIGQLSADTVVEVNGRNDSETNWLRIDFNGEDGWVAFFTVTLEGDPDNLPIIEVGSVELPELIGAEVLVATPIVLENTGPFVTSFRRVNVRSGPGTDFELLGMLRSGETAPITGRTEDNEWLQVEFNDQPGWVAYFVVSVTGELENIPVVITPTITPVPTSEAPTATPTPIPINLTTRFNSNLRAEPDFSSEVVAIVPFDTTLQIEVRTADSNWLRVTYEGQTGWLVASLVNITPRGEIESIPVAVAAA